MDGANLQLAVDLRHELHAHPELSNNEIWTKAHLMEFVRSNTDLEIIDKGKWFYVAYHGGGERHAVGFRADFDALPIHETCALDYASKFPGIGHKCGHDGHAASLAGFALELYRLKPNREVYLVFQHAEETGDGAYECADFVSETGIKEIYAFHNQVAAELGEIKMCCGVSNCASMGMTIEFIGAPTHASLPECGKNPVYELAELALDCRAISTERNFKSSVFATIVQLEVGHHAFGVAASDGRLRVTLRAELDEDLESLRANLEKTARQRADHGGFCCHIAYEDVFPSTVNDISCCQKVKSAAEALGYKFAYFNSVNRGSEDFGWFLRQIPGALFFVGIGKDVPSFHTSDYDFNDGAIEYAVEMFKKLIE